MRLLEALRREAEHQRELREAGEKVRAKDCVLARLSGLALALGGVGLYGAGLWIASKGWISIHFFVFGVVAFTLGVLQLITGAHLAVPRRKSNTPGDG